MKREVRTFSGAELRAKSSEKPGADGYAAVFNTVADLGFFKETIKPGAFSRAITEKQDVRCLQNHDSNLVLGRTKSNSLALIEDSKGLKFSCDFPDTQAARDLRTLLDRGDVDQCSFGFIVRKQTWQETKLEDGRFEDMRIIEDVDLMDVSIVTYPAYDQTSAQARQAWPEGTPPEVRARHERFNNAGDCECNCPECQDGDCEECSNQNCMDENCRCMRSAHGHETREAKTKRVDGEDLTAECFLIVGDPEKTNTWKLPWKFSTDEKTKSHLRNALARFNQLKGVSEEEKAKAWKKLVSLCKEHDIDVTEADSAKWQLTELQVRDLNAPDPPDEAATTWAKARARVVLASLQV